MKNRIYKKCLSVILSSSLVLSPSFATNEAKSEKNNTRTAKWVQNAAYFAKACKIGCYIIAGTYATVIGAAAIFTGYAYLNRDKIKAREMGRRYLESRMREMREEEERQRIEAKEKAKRKKEEDENFKKWHDAISEEAKIKIFKKFLKNKGIGQQWRKEYCDIPMRDVGELVCKLLIIGGNQEDGDKKVGNQSKEARALASFINNKYRDLDPQDQRLLEKEIEKIYDLSDKYNYDQYREYQNRMLMPKLLEIKKREKRELERMIEEENDKILRLREAEIDKGIYKAEMSPDEVEKVKEIRRESEGKRRILEKTEATYEAVKSFYGDKPLTEPEQRKYKKLSNKYNEALSLIEGIVNDHGYNKKEGLSLMIHDIANVLDPLLENVEDLKGEETSTDIREKVEDYAIEVFKRKLYEESFMDSRIKSMIIGAGLKLDMDSFFDKSFINVDGNIGTCRLAEDREISEVRNKIAEKFDLDVLKQVAKSEDNGIFKKFSPEFINQYRDECMKNEVGFKEYCFYASKKAEDFKADIDNLRKSNEESKESKDLDEWVKGKKDLSFNDLRKSVEKLNSNVQKDLDAMFPGAKTKDEDIANILMIADMVKNKYFTVADSKIEETIR